jgi:hypothetical protein
MKVSAGKRTIFATVSPNRQRLPHKGLDHGFSVTITNAVRVSEHRRQAHAPDDRFAFPHAHFPSHIAPHTK